MNKYTLSFLNKDEEHKYQMQQFQMEKFIIQNMRIVFTICALLLVIINYANGSYIYATIVLVGVIVAQFLLKIALLKPLYLDFFILIIQMCLQTIYPVMIYFEIHFGTETSVDISKQFIRASLICLISYCLLIGSKYYFKALVFIYQIIIQLVLYNLKSNQINIQMQLYSILVCMAAIFYTYINELATKRQYIQKQQSITFNQSILRSFRQSWFQCYSKKGLLFLQNCNEICKSAYFDERESFIQFCEKCRLLSQNQTNLLTYLNKLLSNIEIRDNSIAINCRWNQQILLINISSLLTESNQMLLVTISKQEESILVNKVKELKLIVSKIHYQTQIINKDYHLSPKYRLFKLQIQFNFLFSKYLKKEQSKPIGINDFIKDILDSNKELMKRHKIKLYLKVLEQDRQLMTMKYHLYLLLNVIIMESCCRAKNNSVIMIRLYTIFNQIGNEIFSFSIRYFGVQLEQEILYQLQNLLQKIGYLNTVQMNCNLNRLEYVLHIASLN